MVQHAPAAHRKLFSSTYQFSQILLSDADENRVLPLSKHFSMTVQPRKKKDTLWFPLFSWPVPFHASPGGFYGERVGVGVQREFTGSVAFIRWSDKMNHETEIWGVLVQLARLQKIVKCRDKHWQLPLWCHVAASFTAEAPWVSRRYSCFLPSRVNKYVGDPLTFHPERAPGRDLITALSEQIKHKMLAW